MKLYLRYGIIYIALVLGINLAFDFSWATLGDFFYVIAIVALPAIIVSIVVRIVPQSIFNPKNALFNVKEKETQRLQKLKVHKWKDKIPEVGSAKGFKKNKLYDPYNPNYIKEFLKESCIAEAIHSMSILWGLVSLLLVPKHLLLPLGIPIFVFVFLVHIFPILIQRYIRPRLQRTLEMIEKRQAKQQQTENTTQAQSTDQPFSTEQVAENQSKTNQEN